MPHTTRAASAAEAAAAGALPQRLTGRSLPKLGADQQGGQRAFRLTPYPFSPAALLYLLTTALSTTLPLFWGALTRRFVLFPFTQLACLLLPLLFPQHQKGVTHTLSVACLSVSLPPGAHPTPVGSPRPASPDKNSVLSPRRPQTQGQEMHKQKHSPHPHSTQGNGWAACN